MLVTLLLFSEVQLHRLYLICVEAIFISNDGEARHVTLVGSGVCCIDQGHVILAVAGDEAGASAFALADADAELAACLLLQHLGGLLVGIQTDCLTVQVETCGCQIKLGPRAVFFGHCVKHSLVFF